jgi:hypothetical protein
MLLSPGNLEEVRYHLANPLSENNLSKVNDFLFR